MSTAPEATPSSDGELFDLLHKLFGIGDHDEDDPQPWFRFKMTETAKIKAIRKRRHISIADFTLAARYCYRRRITVHYAWQIPQHLLDAKREAKRVAVSDLAEEVEAAVATEQACPHPDERWVQRLLRARGPYRREVLDEWAQHRSATPVATRGDS